MVYKILYYLTVLILHSITFFFFLTEIFRSSPYTDNFIWYKKKKHYHFGNRNSVSTVLFIIVFLETQFHLLIKRKLIICFFRINLQTSSRIIIFINEKHLCCAVQSLAPRASNKIWIPHPLYNLKGHLFFLFKRFSTMQSHTSIIEHTIRTGERYNAVFVFIIATREIQVNFDSNQIRLLIVN